VVYASPALRPSSDGKFPGEPAFLAGDLADFLLAGLTYSIGWWGSRVGPALGYAGPKTHRPCRGTGRDTLHIDNSTTLHPLVEWMGSATDERDGRILLGLLSREGVTDTDELTEDEWLGLLDEAASIRRTEDGDPPA
jgi:hypothetical protein